MVSNRCGAVRCRCRGDSDSEHSDRLTCAASLSAACWCFPAEITHLGERRVDRASLGSSPLADLPEKALLVSGRLKLGSYKHAWERSESCAATPRAFCSAWLQVGVGTHIADKPAQHPSSTVLAYYSAASSLSHLPWQALWVEEACISSSDSVPVLTQTIRMCLPSAHWQALPFNADKTPR